VTITTETLTRNIDALSPAQQQVLLDSHVVIAGCGGLGGFVAEELARIGVGHLSLFDPDVFNPSNSNRQINALSTTLGCNKAEITAKKIAEMGTGCTAVAYPTTFNHGLPDIQDPIDLAVDCLDSIGARYALAEQCNARQIPMVHGAVSKWYGQVGVQLPGFDLPALVFPGKKESVEAAPSVLSFTVAAIASLQACEAVKLLLQLPSPLHNTWMSIDLKHNTFDLMEKP